MLFDHMYDRGGMVVTIVAVVPPQAGWKLVAAVWVLAVVGLLALIRVRQKIRRYHSDSITVRQSLACLPARPAE